MAKLKPKHEYGVLSAYHLSSIVFILIYKYCTTQPLLKPRNGTFDSSLYCIFCTINSPKIYKLINHFALNKTATKGAFCNILYRCSAFLNIFSIKHNKIWRPAQLHVGKKYINDYLKQNRLWLIYRYCVFPLPPISVFVSTPNIQYWSAFNQNCETLQLLVSNTDIFSWWIR